MARTCPSVASVCTCCLFFFFFNDTATTEIYTLSLHDALPISPRGGALRWAPFEVVWGSFQRSEEHTSELQSRGLISYAVFCLKKKKITIVRLRHARAARSRQHTQGHQPV